MKKWLEQRLKKVRVESHPSIGKDFLCFVIDSEGHSMQCEIDINPGPGFMAFCATIASQELTNPKSTRASWKRKIDQGRFPDSEEYEQARDFLMGEIREAQERAVKEHREAAIRSLDMELDDILEQFTVDEVRERLDLAVARHVMKS